MSEEEKPTTPAAKETEKQEESTAEFAPVVRPFVWSCFFFLTFTIGCYSVPQSFSFALQPSDSRLRCPPHGLLRCEMKVTSDCRHERISLGGKSKKQIQPMGSALSHE
jgi:hypothetical protein